MTAETKILDRQRRFRRIPSRRINDLIDESNAGKRGVASPRQVIPPPISLPIRMRITAISGDYLTCKRIIVVSGAAEVVEDQTVNVAKPPRLRKSETSRNSITFSGYSTDGQSRTATNTSSETESQTVVTPYLVDDEILAQRVFNTGVTDATEWVDLNVDARAWAKVAE